MTDKQSSQALAEWQHVLKQDGVDAALASLVDTFKQSGELHRLFEVRQMQVRHSLGLAAHFPPKLDTLSQEKQNDLEKGLVEACREVGLALLDEGQIAEAWMYLRAVGDKPQIAEHLRKLHSNRVKPNHNEEQDEEATELTEQAIHLALYEGVDPAWGLGLLLNHHGTCNSITSLSGMFPSLDRETRAAVSGTMLKHLHEEVLGNLKSDMENRKLPAMSTDTSGSAITQMINEHPVLVADQAYHVDLSHLMSTMQFARSTTGESDWQLALDLAEYGSQITSPMISPGEEPFVDFYPQHRAYFSALLAIDADANLRVFADRANSVDKELQGPHAAEVYVDLLARMGRFQEAAAASSELLPPGTQTLGVAPSLLELSQQANDYGAHLKVAEARGDLLAFAQGMLGQQP